MKKLLIVCLFCFGVVTIFASTAKADNDLVDYLEPILKSCSGF